MTLNPVKAAILAMTFGLMLPALGWATVPCVPYQLYCQPWDETGNAYSSQNDTGGGNTMQVRNHLV